MTPDEEALVRLFRAMDRQRRSSLLDFARFLSALAEAERSRTTLVPQPRPDKEAVVQAIKRLNKTYPMLPRHRLAPRVEQLLAEHMVDARDAAKVIEELESFYAEQYAARMAGPAGG
jgi:hypothetical protein